MQLVNCAKAARTRGFVAAPAPPGGLGALGAAARGVGTRAGGVLAGGLVATAAGGVAVASGEEPLEEPPHAASVVRGASRRARAAFVSAPWLRPPNRGRAARS
jgi:hypothetical protein